MGLFRNILSCKLNNVTFFRAYMNWFKGLMRQILDLSVPLALVEQMIQPLGRILVELNQWRLYPM